MEVYFKNKKIEEIFFSLDTSYKKYGDKMTYKMQQRLNELKAIDNIEMLIKFKIGRCHKLEAKRKDEYALDLVHPYRLIFKSVNNLNNKVKIIEIVDYH